MRRSIGLALAIWAIQSSGACGGGGHTVPKDTGVVGDTSTADTSIVDTGPDADTSCPTPGVIPTMHAQLIVGTGLTQPVYVVQPPGSADLFVVEKPGRIRIVRAGALLGAAFLDVTAEVNIPSAQAEGGLLGLTFAADYVTSGRYWVYLSLLASSGKPDRVAVREYHRSTANPDVSDAAPVADLIDAPQDGFNSLGGTVLLGRDGKLWVAMGDAGAAPPSTALSEDLTSRRGKMLRIDPDNPSVPPADNLVGGDPYIWDYGFRNPYRWSFDRKTGDAYIADAGDTAYEEVNLEPPATGHRDYGWPRWEGMHCQGGAASCGAPGTLPIYERAHEITASVIIGGNVYRGSALPCLHGRYIFGMFGVGRILSWVWNGSAVTSEVDLTAMMLADLTNIAGFGEDLAGELYMVTLDGKLYEIVPG